MNPILPSHARVVIVGGGIAGCSTAYHLAKLGITDVVILEQGKLTSGTTWHAAGLIGQMRPNRSMTAMSKYGIELYATLEAETGMATGWKQCGSLNVAKTPERMKVLKKQLAMARSFGVECVELSPQEAGEKYPLLRTEDLQGAIWLPGDGKANPADLCMSLAKGARNKGVKIFEGIEVTGVLQEGGAAVGVLTAQGEIRCETVVNCAGQWARQFGKLAGVNVPLYSAEHFYIVTEKIEGVHPMLPVMRDPDGFIYYKEEVGGLLMGGFEPVAKPWKMDPIPSHFQFALLDEDWDQFEPLMTAAIHRTPCLETAKIKMLLNGPESFTPDGNFIIGQAPELKNYFVAAGFNSAGIANSGGAGRLIAQWIQDGKAPHDVWEVDIRRFAPFTGNKKALFERTAETLGLHYAMRWPRQELSTVRPLRTSPLYDLLNAKNAEWGSKNGWERVNYFKPAGASSPTPTLAKPAWLEWVIAEQKATREAVAIYDQSSFSKLQLEGPDALTVLQRLCAAEMDVAIGKMVYTPVLNDQAGFESDLTVIRLSEQKFLIITGSAQTTRDADVIRKTIQATEFAVLTDLSTMYSVLSIMGPKSQELLARVSPDDCSPSGLAFSSTKEIDLAYAKVRVAKMSYVGGKGYELYVPVEMTRHVYLALHQAGADLGLKDAGYYALDALRIEAKRRAWGAELSPDESPIESGMLKHIALEKNSPFIGQLAVRKKLAQTLHKKLVYIELCQSDDYIWGGETIWLNQQPVGEISSAGWGYAAGKCIAMAYVRGDCVTEAFNAKSIEVDVWGERVKAIAFDLCERIN